MTSFMEFTNIARYGMKCHCSKSEGYLFTFIFSDHLHPGSRVHLHQGVRYEDHMHPIENTLQQQKVNYNKYFNYKENIERHTLGMYYVSLCSELSLKAFMLP